MFIREILHLYGIQRFITVLDPILSQLYLIHIPISHFCKVGYLHCTSGTPLSINDMNQQVIISRNATILVTVLLTDADLDLHFTLFDSISRAFSAVPCLLYDLLISPYLTVNNLQRPTTTSLLRPYIFLSTPVLEHTPCTFFRSCDPRPSFTLIQNDTL